MEYSSVKYWHSFVSDLRMFLQGWQVLLLVVSVLGKDSSEKVDDPKVKATYFNPMELYVDAKEGVSLAYDDGQGQSYMFCQWYQGLLVACDGWPYKVYETRMLVGPSTEADVYPMTFTDSNSGNPYTANLRVKTNNDGTVSLSCVDTGLYVTWGNKKHDGGEWFAYTEDFGHPPVCTEQGICPHCKFTLVVGSITDIQFTIVDISWGDPEQGIPGAPSQVTMDYFDNYSDNNTETTLTVTYTNEISDTTIWEHAWGFELSISAEFKVGIPFIGGGSVTTTATTSYDGKYGTENTVTSKEELVNTKKVTCPPHSR